MDYDQFRADQSWARIDEELYEEHLQVLHQSFARLLPKNRKNSSKLVFWPVRKPRSFWVDSFAQEAIWSNLWALSLDIWQVQKRTAKHWALYELLRRFVFKRGWKFKKRFAKWVGRPHYLGRIIWRKFCQQWLPPGDSGAEPAHQKRYWAREVEKLKLILNFPAAVNTRENLKRAEYENWRRRSRSTSEKVKQVSRTIQAL